MDIPTNISVVTYNIDSQEHNYEERLKAFFGYVRNNQPDVICIQEGCRLTFEKILRELGNLKYKRYLPEIMHHRRTGEAIFSKFSVSQCGYTHFKNSTDNKGLSYCKLDLGFDINLWIVNSQLEEKVPWKREVLSHINRLLRDIPQEDHVIMCCDTGIMNFHSVDAPEGYVDVWYEAGSDKEKYTVDGSKNMLVEHSNIKDRPDRIYFRFPTNSVLTCEDCRLYGHDSDITISRHFGVIAKFSVDVQF